MHTYIQHLHSPFHSAVGPVGKVSVSWLERDNVPLGFFYSASREVEDAAAKKHGRQLFEPVIATAAGHDLHTAAPSEPLSEPLSEPPPEKCMVVSNRVLFHRLGSPSAEDLLLFELTSETDSIALVD